jgi:hypothetical protein
VRSSDVKQGASPSSVYVIDPPQETAEELAAQFQALYAELEERLLGGGVSPVTARPTHENFLDSEQEKARERRLSGKSVSEQHLRKVLEAVERVLCSLFYDRSVSAISCLISVADLSHDQTVPSPQVR